MNEQTEAVRAHDSPPLGPDRGGTLSRPRSRTLAASRDGVKDATAGLVASVVLIANIVSFGALMFPGDLSAGIPIAIWAMLIGSCIGGVWIALATSLPPLATGIDSPTGAVLVLLSAAAGSGVVAAGGSPQTAVQTVMLIFTAATLISGALLYGLGVCRWGSYFRFVPYFVVGGFLAATGWFLIAGGVRMTTGRTLALTALAHDWTPIEIAKLAAAVAALLVLLAVRRWGKSAFAMPAALLVMWLTGAIVLRSLGLSGPEHGWYLPSLGALTEWSPFEAARTSHLTWSTMAGLIPELLAVTIVALISLVTKVSSIEVARQASGNLDREFRAHGIASLIAAPFGGITSSLQTGTSRLLEHAGGATRMSGVVCALALGAVGVGEFRSAGTDPDPHCRRPRLLPGLHVHRRRPVAALLSARLVRSAARRRHHDRVHRVRLPGRRAGRRGVRLRGVCHQLCALGCRAPARDAGPVCELCRPLGGGVRAFARDRRRHPALLAFRLHFLRLLGGRVRAHPR